MTSPVSRPSNKRSKGSAVYVAVTIAMLALVVAGIEITRRLKAPADAVTAVPAAAKPFPRELRDAKGETLILPHEPQRIVSQTLGTDEILLAICPTERVVALSNLAEDGNYSNIVEEARQIPNRTTQGPEQILQFKPDLIFVASYSRAETVEPAQVFQSAGFQVRQFRFDRGRQIEHSYGRLRHGDGRRRGKTYRADGRGPCGCPRAHSQK